MIGIIVIIVSYYVGVFGWSQIVGSIQNVKTRGWGLTIFTITLWSLIIGGSIALIILFCDYWVWIISILASLISLIQTLKAGKVE